VTLQLHASLPLSRPVRTGNFARRHKAQYICDSIAGRFSSGSKSKIGDFTNKMKWLHNID
jgi:hypothetical protein